MAATNAAKLASILDFSSHLNKLFSESSPSQTATLAELPNYLAALPVSPSGLPQPQRTQVRKCAVALWNSCNKFNVSDAGNGLAEKDVAQTMALSFLLLESIIKRNWNPPRRSEDKEHKAQECPQLSFVHMKHFQLGNDAARYCLHVNQVEHANRIVELLAKRYAVLLNSDDGINNVSASQSNLVANFVCLRIFMGWKRDRLDLASHQNSRFDTIAKRSNNHQVSVSCVEKWLDLIYEIGNDELSHQRTRSASKWFRCAIDFFDDKSQDDLGGLDLSNVRLNTLHAYVRSLLSEEDADAGVEALKFNETLRKDYGDRLPVMLLQLEILSKDPTSSPDAFFAELMPIVRSAHVIESNHKLVVYYVHKLHDLSRSHASRALQQYIILRLVHQDNCIWTESAIITLIWMFVVPQESVKDFDATSLTASLDAVADVWKSQLSVEAAHAGLVLLWRHIDKLSIQEPQQGIGWCMIGLHRLFANAGEDHIGKVERKLIVCYHSQHEYDSARDILNKMSTIRRSHHLSRYLAYCTYLRLNDETESDAALSAIVTSRNQDNRLLFACVSETMKHGSKIQSARLLQRLLDKFSSGSRSDANLPTLLRCTARLLMSIVGDPQLDQDEVLTRLCHVLKAAVMLSSPDNTSNKEAISPLPYADCCWFAQHSFNIAVKHLKKWPARYVIDMLQYSSQICYPVNTITTTPDTNHQKEEHNLSIAFIQAVLYAAESRDFHESFTIEHLPRTSFSSRSKPRPDQILYTLYKNVLDRYWQIMQAYDIHNKMNTHSKIEDLHAHVCTILPLAFEALVHINNHVENPKSIPTGFDEISLTQIIDKAVKIEAPPKVYALLADIVLCAVVQQKPPAAGQHTYGGPGEQIMPLTSATKLLSKIIQAVRNLEVYDICQAARWIRCIVQLIIDNNGINDDAKTSTADYVSGTVIDTNTSLLRSIIDQSIMLARSAAELAANQRDVLRHIEDDTDVEMLDDIPDRSNSKDTRKESVYPPEELEYLATVLFNTAVDLYVAGNEDQAKWYAGKAVEVADVLALPGAGSDDRGMLANLLRQKTGSLGWVL